MQRPRQKPGARGRNVVSFGDDATESSRVPHKIQAQPLGPGELAVIAYYRERHPRLRVIDGGRDA